MICWLLGHKFKMLPFVLGGPNIECERCGYRPGDSAAPLDGEKS